MYGICSEIRQSFIDNGEERTPGLGVCVLPPISSGGGIRISPPPFLFQVQVIFCAHHGQGAGGEVGTSVSFSVTVGIRAEVIVQVDFSSELWPGFSGFVPSRLFEHTLAASGVAVAETFTSAAGGRITSVRSHRTRPGC